MTGGAIDRDKLPALGVAVQRLLDGGLVPYDISRYGFRCWRREGLMAMNVMAKGMRNILREGRMLTVLLGGGQNQKSDTEGDHKDT
jgi:hypothetical protein